MVSSMDIYIQNGILYPVTGYNTILEFLYTEFHIVSGYRISYPDMDTGPGPGAEQIREIPTICTKAAARNCAKRRTWGFP